MLSGNLREIARLYRRQRAGAAHVNVEAVIGRSHLDIERLGCAPQTFSDRPGRSDSAAKGRRQHRTAVDGHHAVTARRRKSDFEHIAVAAPGMKHGPAAAVAVRVDQVPDRGIEAGQPHRFHNQVALPCPIMVDVPVLDGTAAAYAEVWANRSDPFGIRNVDAQKMPPVRMTGYGFDLDRLARQRTGHIDRAGWIVGDTVAAMAEPRDREPLNQAPPRRRIRRCRRRQGSATAGVRRRANRARQEIQRCRRIPLRGPRRRARCLF